MHWQSMMTVKVHSTKCRAKPLLGKRAPARLPACSVTCCSMPWLALKALQAGYVATSPASVKAASDGISAAMAVSGGVYSFYQVQAATARRLDPLHPPATHSVENGFGKPYDTFICGY